MDSELPSLQTANQLLSQSPADVAGDAGMIVRHLTDWGASEALQAAGALHELAHAPEFDAHAMGDSLATAWRTQTVDILAAYHEFYHTGSLFQPPVNTARSQTAPLNQHSRLTGDARRGDLLVLQLSHAYCGAYRDPELGFLYAAILWQRFLAARAMKKSARRAYANEARLLLAPFLEMLGMRELRTSVDNWLAQQPNASHAEPVRDLQTVYDQITAQLEPQMHWAHFRLSTYTQTHNLHFSSVTQLPTNPLPALTIDVLVDDDEACYRALYWIQQTFTPVESGLVDNIKVERVNGYRGLSSTVWADIPGQPRDVTLSGGGDGQTRESAKQKLRVQFRMVTTEMDEVNRWGLAAFLMRSKKTGPLPSGWWRERAAGQAKIAVGEPGSFPETLYVFSPLGQLFEFRRGCTVVDFAYHVHSVLADHCVRFYVNGRAVEPTAVLHHLDLVKLEHDVHAPGPTQVWRNAARTGRARAKIDSFLRRRSRGAYQGQQTLNHAMSELETYYGFSIPEHRTRQAVRNAQGRLNLTSREEFLAEIAAGRLDARRFLHRLFDEEIVRQVKLPAGLHLRPHQMHLAGCCHPRLGDAVVGHVKRRGGSITRLKIHQQACELGALVAQPSADKVELKWRLQPTLNEFAQIEMTALDGDQLLGDAIAQVYAASPRVILHRSLATARNGVARIAFTLEAESRELLESITAGLRRLPDRSVDRVRLMNLPPSEQEEILTAGLLKTYNPYSRLPVRQRELFFGRKNALVQIADWLRLDDGNIWLRGQKRVGKTSLLFHLKRHYLSRREFVPVFVDFQQFSASDGPAIFYSVANAIHTELQGADSSVASRIDEVGSPLNELFALHPSQQLTEYLLAIQSKLGQRQLVLLLDEFSRTIDAWEQGHLDPEFFVQWRGMMLNTPGINCVTVVQQRTYDRLRARPQPRNHTGMQEPVWELLELGEQLTLRPLDEQDVRRLIEWPMQNFLDYAPETVEHVAAMTGGSPFLIHAFCSRLTAHMNRTHRRQVTPADVELVCQEFMQPSESLFAHMLDMFQGIGNTVAQTLAELADVAPDHTVSEMALGAAVPNIDPAKLRRTLQELETRDIVEMITPAQWRFCNRLFQRWLAVNPTGETGV